MEFPSKNHEDNNINPKRQWEESFQKLPTWVSPLKHQSKHRKISAAQNIQEMASSLKALKTENASLWVMVANPSNPRLEFNLEYGQNNNEPTMNFIT